MKSSNAEVTHSNPPVIHGDDVLGPGSPNQNWQHDPWQNRNEWQPDNVAHAKRTWHDQYTSQLRPLLLTVGLLAAVELLSRLGIPLLDPAIIFVIAVSYAAFKGGISAGLISSALSFAYALYFFALPGKPFSYPAQGIWHLALLALVFPALVLLLAGWKPKARQTPMTLMSFVEPPTPLSPQEELELALRQSEERVSELYREFYDEAPICYHELDSDGRITRVNRTECALLGYTAEEMIGKPVKNFIYEPDSVLSGNGKQRSGAFPERTHERKFRRKDGSLLPALFEERPIHDDTGRVVGLRATAQDVSERNRVELARQESEARFRSAFEATGVGMALVSFDTRFLQVNQALCELIGYADRDLLLHSWLDISYPDDTEAMTQIIGKLLAGDSRSVQLEQRLLHRQGHLIWVKQTASLVRDQSNKPRYIVLQLQNISEHKQGEAALQQGQNLLRGILAGASDAIYVKDLQGHYLIINAAGAQVLGRSITEIIGKDDTAFFPPENARFLAAWDKQIIETGETSTSEIALTIGGTPHIFRITQSPYRDHRGQIIGIIGVSHDMTERQRAAEHLENSRSQLRALSARLQLVREEERTRIAREVHDELGQMLTGLKIDIVSLTKRLSDPQSREQWEKLIERGQGITQLINECVQTVRKISTELRPALLDAVGLTAAIEWQVEEFQKRTGIKCQLRIPPTLRVLDQERAIAVFRIFQEILTNITRHSQATEVDVVLEERGPDMVLRARDNGRGIRASELSNPKSLGLLGMRERALLLGGEVNISGRQGSGTTVLVRIPLDKVEPAETEPPSLVMK